NHGQQQRYGNKQGGGRRHDAAVVEDQGGDAARHRGGEGRPQTGVLPDQPAVHARRPGDHQHHGPQGGQEDPVPDGPAHEPQVDGSLAADDVPEGGPIPRRQALQGQAQVGRLPAPQEIGRHDHGGRQGRSGSRRQDDPAPQAQGLLLQGGHSSDGSDGGG